MELFLTEKAVRHAIDKYDGQIAIQCIIEGG